MDQPPQPTIDLITAPPNPTNQTGANFAFSDSDPTVTSFSCQLDGGGFSPCSSPQPYLGLTPNASHTFDVKAVDGLANESEVASYTWSVDTLGTDTPTIDPASEPSNPTNQTGANFSFSSDSSATSFQCQLDGGGFSTCSSPQPYSGLGDGSHTFDVKALDALANESGVASYTWTIDTLAPATPTIDPASKPPNPTNQTGANFSFSSDSSATSFQCQLDGGGFSTCSSPKPYPALTPNASHTFEVKALDALANESGVASYTWTIDTIGPDARRSIRRASPRTPRIRPARTSPSLTATRRRRHSGANSTAAASRPAQARSRIRLFWTARTRSMSGHSTYSYGEHCFVVYVDGGHGQSARDSEQQTAADHEPADCKLQLLLEQGGQHLRVHARWAGHEALH